MACSKSIAVVSGSCVDLEGLLMSDQSSSDSSDPLLS